MPISASLTKLVDRALRLTEAPTQQQSTLAPVIADPEGEILPTELLAKVFELTRVPGASLPRLSYA